MQTWSLFQSDPSIVRTPTQVQRQRPSGWWPISQLVPVDGAPDLGPTENPLKFKEYVQILFLVERCQYDLISTPSSQERPTKITNPLKTACPTDSN